jgi:hypothetical protein
VSPFVRKTKAFLLPVGYDPRNDQGRVAVDQFLDEDEPPNTISVEEVSPGQWSALATWYETDS